MTKITLPESKKEINVKSELNYGEYKSLGYISMETLTMIDRSSLDVEKKELVGDVAKNLLNSAKFMDESQLRVAVIFTDFETIDQIKALSPADVAFLLEKVADARTDYDKKKSA